MTLNSLQSTTSWIRKRKESTKLNSIRRSKSSMMSKMMLTLNTCGHTKEVWSSAIWRSRFTFWYLEDLSGQRKMRRTPTLVTSAKFWPSIPKRTLSIFSIFTMPNYVSQTVSTITCSWDVIRTTPTLLRCLEGRQSTESTWIKQSQRDSCGESLNKS